MNVVRLPRALLLAALASATLAAPGVALWAMPALRPAGVQASRPAPHAPSLTAAAAAARAAQRIRALQREGDALAKQEQTLLVELRRLEVERDLRLEQARQADTQVAEVTRQIQETSEQVRITQARLDAARPGLEARLVEVYKLGRPRYARLLLGVEDLMDMARASRMVGALAELDRRQVAEFTAVLNRHTAAAAALERQSAELKALHAAAREAGMQAQRAAEARAALVARIDARRDLNAQMMTELQAAHDRLAKTLAAGSPPAPDEVGTLPLRPFRGAITWPAAGRVSSRFGEQRHRRFGTTTLQNGIELSTSEATPVKAVHEGRVAFAGVFTGFGQLVIVDHGGLAYSLYGYLSAVDVSKGARVGRGQRVGATGRAPAGNSALYFELRIDGKPVDPLQWLEAK